jgi:hypothetical protein
MVAVSPTSSRIENDVFRHRNATDEQFASILQFYHQVLGEDKVLCEKAQNNINAGVYVNGEFHPEKEKVRTMYNGELQCMIRSVV